MARGATPSTRKSFNSRLNLHPDREDSLELRVCSSLPNAKFGSANPGNCVSRPVEGEPPSRMTRQCGGWTFHPLCAINVAP